MAETIKSVLFVDYDSVHRSLASAESEAADRLAPRVAAWLTAIEAGKIFVATPEPARRRILLRRCYADPALIGDERSVFLSNGFQLIDCPPAEGRDRNAAVVHMVLDAIDALEHPADYEEFVLLSADTDLSPILIRLRAHNRRSAIYTNSATADSYKAIADAMIDEARLASLLMIEEEEPAEDDQAAQPQAERSAVEALARRISAVTNIPLLAPRTFAELFRHLIDEITENGYHFQTTAENVATRMAAAGRSVTRRQVIFVVKGLALKGHVFSTGDTADRLAEAFREQVLYLAESAGLNLDEGDRTILSFWIVGRAPPAAAGAAQKSAFEPATAGASTARGDSVAKVASKTGEDQAGRSARRKPPKATFVPRSEPIPPPAKAVAEPPAKPAEATRPPATAKPPGEAGKPPPAAAKSAEEAKPAPARPILGVKPAPASAKPIVTPPRAPVAPAKAAPGTGSTPPTTKLLPLPGAAVAKPVPAGAPRTPPTTKPTSPPPVSDADKEAVESSILAAIAQAVDVLVEDSGGKSSTPAPAKAAEIDPSEKKLPPATDPAADAEEPPEGDDIGDEIQRIIASYNRNRSEDERR